MTDITLLDGSIGQELVKRSGDAPTPFWSTSVMIDHPELVRQVHDAYFAAGATVATTNTYAVLRDRFEKFGALEERLDELRAIAIATARAARDAHGAGRVAGSIGPLMATYRPELCPPADQAEALYAETVAGMVDGTDLLLLESMASVEQAEGALRAAKKAALPVWLSVTLQDDDGSKLRSGEALADLEPVVARYAPDAVLINCSRPEAVSAGLDILKGFGLPFGAYANGFTEISEEFLKDSPTVDALTARTDLTPQAYARFALSWVDQGATIVGGCCEVGPEHIAELANQLKSAGHKLV